MMVSVSSPPNWELLFGLVAPLLNPKTLALSSCVCKSWSLSLSSDNLWEPLCTTHFPSLPTTIAPKPPYRRLYALGHIAAKRRSQVRLKPQLSLSNLLFTIIIKTSTHNINASVVKTGGELMVDPNGLFKFDINVKGQEEEELSSLEEVRVVWNVVLEGWRGVFTMMDCVGKVKLSGGGAKSGEGWFSEELPLPPGCSLGGRATSGIVADVKLGVSCSCRRGIGKVSLGILSVVNWRYVGLEDGLKYLQHFLLPCGVD